MKTATVSDLKNQLSKYLRLVKQGEVVTVLERGVPIAELQPRTKAAQSASLDRLRVLEASGIVRHGDPKRLKNFVFPETQGVSGAVAALLEERRSGR